MKFSFERTVITMLFSKFILIAVMMSLILFLVLQQQAQQQAQQERANQTGTILINKIFEKLDVIHAQSDELVNAQGNISNVQRAQLIKEFADVASDGGLATRTGQANNNHMLTEILGNITELNNRDSGRAP